MSTAYNWATVQSTFAATAPLKTSKFRRLDTRRNTSSNRHDEKLSKVTSSIKTTLFLKEIILILTLSNKFLNTVCTIFNDYFV